MRGTEGDRAALEDMSRYADFLLSHTAAGRTVLRDELALHGVLWELAMLGEAANRLSEPFRLAHAEVPWRRILNQRNILVHVHDQVDLDLVWEAIASTSRLRDQIQSILHDRGER